MKLDPHNMSKKTFQVCFSSSPSLFIIFCHPVSFLISQHNKTRSCMKNFRIFTEFVNQFFVAPCSVCHFSSKLDLHQWAECKWWWADGNYCSQIPLHFFFITAAGEISFTHTNPLSVKATRHFYRYTTKSTKLLHPYNCWILVLFYDQSGWSLPRNMFRVQV